MRARERNRIPGAELTTEQNRDPDQTAEKPAKMENRRVHMANERTYLAWIRTSIAIMAFGFVVERFSLFMKQMNYYFGKDLLPPHTGYSPLIGVLLVVLGVVMAGLAFLRYKNMEKQIDEDAYRPSASLGVLLFLSLLSIGLFLILYLIHTI
jgi:putative membrane protein